MKIIYIYKICSANVDKNLAVLKYMDICLTYVTFVVIIMHIIHNVRNLYSLLVIGLLSNLCNIESNKLCGHRVRPTRYVPARVQ